jgi:hypothetical protein
MTLLRMMKADEPEFNCSTYTRSIPGIKPVKLFNLDRTAYNTVVRICQVRKDYLRNIEFKVALEKRKQTNKNFMPRSPYGVSLAISQLTASV